MIGFDFAEDFALLSNIIQNAQSLLHDLELNSKNFRPQAYLNMWRHVEPVLISGSETWTLNKQCEKRLNEGPKPPLAARYKPPQKYTETLLPLHLYSLNTDLALQAIV